MLVDDDSSKVVITGTGYAVGHYARWIPKGAVRIAASSDDSLVLVTSFCDSTSRTLTLVIINNHNTNVTMSASASSIGLPQNFRGERSTPDAYWIPITASGGMDGTLSLMLPAMSITTISGLFGSAASVAAGADGSWAVRFAPTQTASFARDARIQFELREGAFVRIRIFDFLGREQSLFADRYFESGEHSIGLTSTLPSGNYLCRLDAAGQSITRIFQVIR